jgi:hypothetical protein
MKNRRRGRMHHNHLRNLMGENLIENFQSKKKVAKQVINLTATQEPLYVEDVNRPMYNMHHLNKGAKGWRILASGLSLPSGGRRGPQCSRAVISHMAGSGCCQTLLEFQTGQSKSNRSQGRQGLSCFVSD